MSAHDRRPITVEPAANADGSVTWIARGTTCGVPYIAEGATEADALAEAAALVFDCHATRRIRQISARQEQHPC